MLRLDKPVKLRRAKPGKLAQGKIVCPHCKEALEFDVLPRAQKKPEGPPPVDPRQLPLPEGP